MRYIIISMSCILNSKLNVAHDFSNHLRTVLECRRRAKPWKALLSRRECSPGGAVTVNLGTASRDPASGRPTCRCKNDGRRRPRCWPPSSCGADNPAILLLLARCVRAGSSSSAEPFLLGSVSEEAGDSWTTRSDGTSWGRSGGRDTFFGLCILAMRFLTCTNSFRSLADIADTRGDQDAGVRCSKTA